MSDFQAGKYKADGCFFIVAIAILCFTAIIITTIICSSPEEAKDLTTEIIEKL